ncbi:MAG: tRNA pseudouridine(54/55) synthase Pus10 [Candidatus Aenigmarchaeota archaeon]|nr:tRNA pseudouridine(54/55) synthase Pus10 [Candidatus Aenigmarchaeota archaeon]
MNTIEKAVEVLKDDYICDSCLGRQFGQLLSGLTNEERGKMIRNTIAMMVDAGEKIEIDSKNLYGIKFRNSKIKPPKPEKCKVCKNFFPEKIDDVAEETVKKLEGIEYRTFLVGSVPSVEMSRAEEDIWQKTGIDFVEPIKSEINREVGKRLEKLTGKTFSMKNPDVTVLVDLDAEKIRTSIRSLFIFGYYSKLVRGIPQTKWLCPECGGKGCKVCKGTGKLYKTSVQEEIEKPFVKFAKARESSFHGAGREDIDARCLAYRPFVIEIVKPKVRKLDLKKIQKLKSKKVKIKSLKFVDKEFVRKIKAAKIDKTYIAVVNFGKNVDKNKLKDLKSLEMKIEQRTPTRVAHRRADLQRKRMVKRISWRVLGKKKLELKIHSESGLYIKELITGDEGRTKPNVSDILGNKVKRILLDVVKIHSKF